MSVCAHTHTCSYLWGRELVHFVLIFALLSLTVHIHCFQILDSSFEMTLNVMLLPSSVFCLFVCFLVIPGHSPLTLDYHNIRQAGLPISFPDLDCTINYSISGLISHNFLILPYASFLKTILLISTFGPAIHKILSTILHLLTSD